MNNITPENLVQVTEGATPIQIVMLVLLGIIAFGAIIGIVKWVIDLKLGTLPQDLKEIRQSLGTLKSDMVRLDSKLWSIDDIDRAMKAKIAEHVEKCPYHHKN